MRALRRWEWLAMALLACALIGLFFLLRGEKARGERPAGGAVYVLAEREAVHMPKAQGNALPEAGLEWRAGPGEKETRRREKEGGVDGWEEGR